MPILCMAYDSTGTLVATGSADRSIRVWDVEKGFCTHSFKGHSDIVQIVQFHPDPLQTVLYSASDDHSIRIWDLVQNECSAAFSNHLSSPKSFTFSPNGYMLVSGGLDQVRLCNLTFECCVLHR